MRKKVIMSEIENFKILEEKVSKLIKRCVLLQEENKQLKKSLEKTEQDMYVLIENQDELKNRNKELNEKLVSIANGSIVKNLIHNIDEIINYSEESGKLSVSSKGSSLNKLNENKTAEEKNTEALKINTANQNTNNNSYNYGINMPEPKINTSQNTEIKQEQKIGQSPSATQKVIHIDENEDPFSSATDGSWDKEIVTDKTKAKGISESVIKEVKTEIKKETVKENENTFEFSIDDDDEYIFGDDEESGFAFDEKN